MTPVEPQESSGLVTPIVLGAGQPEYIPLPALIDAAGTVITEWEPTAEELAILMNGGRIRIETLTFGHPFQPVRVGVKAL